MHKKMYLQKIKNKNMCLEPVDKEPAYRNFTF